MFTLIGTPRIDFIGRRKIAFVVSTILVLVGLTAAVMIGLGKGNLGIDFAGGVMVKGHFAQPVSIDQIRGSLSSRLPHAQVTELSGFAFPNAFIIKSKRPESEAAATQLLIDIKETVDQAFPGNDFVVAEESVIGPSVGGTLQRDARWAVLLSLAGILIYIAVRFDFRSGVAATIATFHDVLAVLGIFWVLGLEFDLLVVTALLTLAGYSLTDTVVIYDRIRENLRKFRGRSEFIPTINRSINETLARTINTSMTVLIVVLILFFFGGDVLRNFSLALILGVLVGSYSSVFVASPIIVEWEGRSPKRFK